MQKKNAKQILNSSFMSYGRINNRQDCEDYNIVISELDEREEFLETLKILKRNVNLDKIEMSTEDRKVVEKTYAKIR